MSGACPNSDTISLELRPLDFSRESQVEASALQCTTTPSPHTGASLHLYVRSVKQRHHDKKLAHSLVQKDSRRCPNSNIRDSVCLFLHFQCQEAQGPPRPKQKKESTLGLSLARRDSCKKFEVSFPASSLIKSPKIKRLLCRF